MLAEVTCEEFREFLKSRKRQPVYEGVRDENGLYLLDQHVTHPRANMAAWSAMGRLKPPAAAESQATPRSEEEPMRTQAKNA